MRRFAINECDAFLKVVHASRSRAFHVVSLNALTLQAPAGGARSEATTGADLRRLTFVILNGLNGDPGGGGRGEVEPEALSATPRKLRSFHHKASLECAA
jgi:hypothetical protein